MTKDELIWELKKEKIEAEKQQIEYSKFDNHYHCVKSEMRGFVRGIEYCIKHIERNT